MTKFEAEVEQAKTIIKANGVNALHFTPGISKQAICMALAVLSYEMRDADE